MNIVQASMLTMKLLLNVYIWIRDGLFKSGFPYPCFKTKLKKLIEKKTNVDPHFTKKKFRIKIRIKQNISLFVKPFHFTAETVSRHKSQFKRKTDENHNT